MKLSNLFNDDKAVSPVIGVILMVAITVILAAVIGTFVLGLGDSIQDTSPSASISGEVSGGDIVFEHQSGQNIDGSDLRISDSGGALDRIDSSYADRGGIDDQFGERFTAGDRIVLQDEDIEDNDGDTMRLVFDSGSTSSTLASVDYEDTNED